MGLLQTLGTAAGTYFGGTGGGAAGAALGGWLDQRMTNQTASSAADVTYERQRELRQTAYQDTMQDLEKAGLNPMLAFSQGPTGVSSVAMPQFTNMWDSSTSATGISNADANQDQASASIQQANNQSKLVWAQVDKIREETKNLKTEGERLVKATELLLEQAELARKQGATQEATVKQIAATVMKLHKEAELLGFDIAAAKSMDNLGRSAGQVRPILEIIRSLFGRSSR